MESPKNNVVIDSDSEDEEDDKSNTKQSLFAGDFYTDVLGENIMAMMAGESEVNLEKFMEVNLGINENDGPECIRV